MKRTKADKEDQKKIAKERIQTLFEQAQDAEQKLANRYVTLARKIGMKFRVRIPSNFKRRYCKHCYNYFRSGNSTIRLVNQKIVYHCLKCKKYSRFPYSKERKSRNSVVVTKAKGL